MIQQLGLNITVAEARALREAERAAEQKRKDAALMQKVQTQMTAQDNARKTVNEEKHPGRKLWLKIHSNPDQPVWLKPDEQRDLASYEKLRKKSEIEAANTIDVDELPTLNLERELTRPNGGGRWKVLGTTEAEQAAKKAHDELHAEDLIMAPDAEF